MTTRERLLERLRAGAIEILTSGEVALLFHVSRRTVHCWAVAGKLSHIRTMGGHRRYLAAAVLEQLDKAGAA